MNNQRRYAFGSPTIQKALNLFAFLLAFPGIEVLGNSLYFYVFMWILYKTYDRTGRIILNSRFAILLFLSWFLGLISTIFHPPLVLETNTISNMMVMVIRYAYWFAIAAYFYSWFPVINHLELAKWLSIGYIFQVIGFYVLSFKFSAFIFSINTSLTRNSFVFNSILFSGVVLYYFYRRFGRKIFLPAGIFILFNLLLTNGRAGAVIGFFAVLVDYGLLNLTIRKLSKLSVVVLIALLFFTKDLEKTIYSYGVLAAPYVESYSPRFANLLKGVDEGDLDFDKSWLLRELMVDKTIEIISKYPSLGIGYTNFEYYSADLNTLYDKKYDRLRSETVDYYNTRSSHNSYANHLSETGIIGFILLLLIIIPIFYRFIIAYWTNSFYQYGGILVFFTVGTIGALLHGYAIAAFTGANIWFMLGISWSILTNKKHETRLLLPHTRI